jgi:hypothetical protein
MVTRAEIIKEWYKQIGKAGGASKSKAKVEAAKNNGKKGGRPPKGKKR